MNEDAGFECWVVLLAGGIGSRFWPASTRRRPKQFLPLATTQPLIVDTIDRAKSIAPQSNILIVTGEHLRAHLQQYLPDFPVDQIMFEPQARGTGPALAWAAQEILSRALQPDRSVMVSLHSDHVIRPKELFATSLRQAVEAAGRLNQLLTIGVSPSRPDTGYGYIEVGTELAPNVFKVRRFIEKPDHEVAQQYVARGFLWNSGMFVWRPQLLLSELDAHTPEFAGELVRLEDGDVPGFFAGVPHLSIDHGLLERSSRIAVTRAQFEWDDVGTWAALRRIRERDSQGNLSVGDVYADGCTDSVLWGEDGPIVAFGLDDIVVVRASGITFVAPIQRANELKDLLARLPQDIQDGLA